MSQNTRFLSREDEELLRRRFHARDIVEPTEFAEGLGEGCEIEQILFEYDETPSGGRKAGHNPNLRCAFGHPQRHWCGYAVKTTEGLVARVGKDCGEHHFGLKFGTVRNQFDQDVERQHHLRLLIALRDLFPQAVEELRTLHNCEAVREFDRYLKELRENFGRIGGRLIGTFRTSQGRLISERLVIDLDAKERRAKREQPKLFEAVEKASTGNNRKKAVRELKKFMASLPEVTKPQRIDFGACAGWTVFEYNATTPRLLLTKAFDQASASLKAVMTRCSDDWSLYNLAKLIRDTKQVLENISAAQALLSDLALFASAENIDRLVGWANSIDENMDFRALQGVLIVDDDFHLRPPVNSQLPPLHSLDAVRNVLDSRERLAHLA